MNFDKYPFISEDLYLHLFGNYSILMDSFGMEYLYDEAQTDIFQYCNGKNSYNEILNNLAKLYSVDHSKFNSLKDSIDYFFQRQVKKKIIQENNEPIETKNIYGQREKFYPTALSIEITSKCNFTCPHCYKIADFTGKDIDPAVIDYVNNFKGKIKQIQLTGGEPFTNPNIENYINMLSLNFEIRIPTNGSLLYNFDDKLISKLKFVQFSLYGCDEEEYKQFTGSSCALNNLIKSIEKVKRCNVDHILSVVLSKNNIYKMEPYIKAAIQMGANRIKFGVPTPVGRAADNTIDNDNSFVLTIDEMRQAYRESRYLKTKYKNDISVGIWSHRSIEPKKPLLPDKKFQNMLPCGGGYLSYVISQDGKLRPCELLPEEYFNLGDYRMLEQYIDGHFFSDYNTILPLYNNVLCKQNINIEDICTPVKTLFDQMQNKKEEYNVYKW